MVATDLRKPDRYKLSSYSTYNLRWRDTYDSCVWLKLFGVKRWDALVAAKIGSEIESIDILDVGCATGRLLTALAQSGARSLCGTDLAPRILEVAEKKLASTGLAIELKAADAEDRIPWPDSSFDVVTLTGVLHHLLRPRDALGEIARVLRPDGRLILLDPWFRPPLRQFLNFCLRIRPVAGDCRYYSPGSAMELLRSLSWREIQSGRAAWSGFVVSAIRPASQ
jgi:ubiquinone/menaquinone biosynthesis C-methylase UbiE